MGLFTNALLPASLWRDSVLFFPDCLNDVYEAKLRSIGRVEDARVHGGSENIYGGENLDETHDHFCRMYPNSLSRVQCVLLDPEDAFSEISRDLLSSMSSHRLAILDIPCGAGASLLSALSTLSELRRSRLLPMTPLSISILGADISSHALAIYREQIDMLAGSFVTTAINVRLDTRKWDATDIQQTNQMIDDWLSDNRDAQEHLVVISNFSGAGKSVITQFEGSFRQIGIRLSCNATPNSTIVWIEPLLPWQVKCSQITHHSHTAHRDAGSNSVHVPGGRAACS